MTYTHIFGFLRVTLVSEPVRKRVIYRDAALVTWNRILIVLIVLEKAGGQLTGRQDAADARAQI